MSKVAKVLAIVLILGIFLPYATVSCSGEKMVTVKATDLALGSDVEGEGLMGDTETYEMDVMPEVTIFCVLVILGLFIMLATKFPLDNAKLKVLAVLYGIASLLALYIPSQFQDYVAGLQGDDYGMDVLDINSEFGYTLTLIISIVLIVILIMQIVKNSKDQTVTTTSTID